MEIDQRDHLLRPGMTVVDLGAAPGSWSQYACRRLGGRGRIVAVDLQTMEPISGVTCLQGDIRRPELAARVAVDGPADLVISDVAPNSSGNATIDQARMSELLDGVLTFSGQALREGGTLLVKVFEGDEAVPFRQRLRAQFATVAVRKPRASRAESREFYCLARGFRLVSP